MNFLKSSGIRGKFLSIVILFLCLMVAGFAITFKLITDMKSDVHVINITTRQGTLVEQYLKSFFFFMETKKIENVTKVVKEFEHNLSVLKEGVKKKSNIIVEGDSEDYEIDSYDIEKELDPYVLNEWKEIGIAWEDLKSVAIGLLSEEGEKKNSGYVVLIENAKKLTARIDQLVLFEQQRSGQKFKNILYSQVAIIALSLLASLIVIVFLNSSYLRSLIQNFSKIDHLAMILLEETKNILTNANVVSKNAEGLSSAVQQTMSAATQLTEITKKNTEITLHSSKKSKDSSKQSESGKKVVRDLIKTIEDVDGANKDLVEQVEKNNNEIHRILEFVHKISEQTSVIDDIVFQTKLLSFNASVEAARAGESGKGFAVVAEEVGALARMSGSASGKISQLLSDSIKEIEDIIASNAKRTDQSLNLCQEKIKEGLTETHACGEVFNSIYDSVSGIDSSMKEIEAASREQSSGISNISDAINHIAQSSYENNKSSTNMSKSIERIESEIQNLLNAVNNVSDDVVGSKKKVSGF